LGNSQFKACREVAGADREAANETRQKQLDRTSRWIIFAIGSEMLCYEMTKS
jgi:hypothetical protein